MSIRLRRLAANREQILRAFAEHPHIRLVSEEGEPPERYTFEFDVTGMVPGPGDTFAPGRPHRAQVFLPLEYPRRPPFCRMITPVFHPNIDPQKICIGDHWTAGQPLYDLVVQIGQMICFQSYNVRSPLNARAAAWAEQNAALLPLDRSDLNVRI